MVQISQVYPTRVDRRGQKGGNLWSSYQKIYRKIVNPVSWSKRTMCERRNPVRGMVVFLSRLARHFDEIRSPGIHAGTIVHSPLFYRKNGNLKSGLAFQYCIPF